MNKIKTYRTWQIIYIFCIIIYIYYCLKYGAIVSLCDSGDTVNDFIINDTNIDCEKNSGNNNPEAISVSSQGLLFKFKRKLSWYISEKRSGKYNSYNEFKNSFSSDIRLKDIIKKDLNATFDFEAKRQNLKNKKDNDYYKLRADIKEQANTIRAKRHEEASKSDWYKNNKIKEASKSNWYNNK